MTADAHRAASEDALARAQVNPVMSASESFLVAQVHALLAIEARLELTPGDWVFCILCGGIACIFGIVYAIQGKPKGLKMVGVSLLAQLFWGAVRVILEAALSQKP